MSAKLSRTAMRSVIRDGHLPSAEIVVMNDRQADKMRKLGEPDPARVTAISEVFGDEILTDRTKVEAILLSQNDVQAQTVSLFESALNIGRSVIGLQRSLSPEEARKLALGTNEIYGLSRSLVSQLVTLATKIDTGRLDIDTCPRSYSVAYQFATLDDDVLKLAVDRGLYRRNVTRKEIMAFKSEVKSNAPLPEGSIGEALVSRRALRGRLDKLKARAHDLRRETQINDSEIDLIERKLRG